MSYLLLLYLVRADQCANRIIIKPGVKHFSFDTNEGDEICINTTLYPSFVVFSTFEKDTLLYKYTSMVQSSNLREDFHTYLRFLPFYMVIPSPFSSFTVQTPSNTSLSFTTVSLPGMCANGILFTNKISHEMVFSKFISGFYGLKVFDDKCLIFTSQGHHNISVDMISDDFEDQLYIYRTFSNFSSISGNSSSTIYGKKDRPVFLRIVADDLSPPDYINLTFQSDSPEPPKPGSSSYVFQYDPPICDEIPVWYSEEITVSMIILLSFLVLLTGILFSMKCVCPESPSMQINSAADGASIASYNATPLLSTFSIQSLYSIEANNLIE